MSESGSESGPMNARAPADEPVPPSLTTRVVTQRLVLRPPRTTDVPAMRAARVDPITALRQE